MARAVLTPSVVLAVVMDGDKVLMLKRKNDKDLLWVFPGGKIDPGETSQHAAERELYEEVGLRCKASHRIGIRKHPNTDKIIEYFMCFADSNAAENREQDKAECVSWLTLPEVEANVGPHLYAPVKEAIRSRSSTPHSRFKQA